MPPTRGGVGVCQFRGGDLGGYQRFSFFHLHGGLGKTGSGSLDAAPVSVPKGNRKGNSDSERIRLVWRLMFILDQESWVRNAQGFLQPEIGLGLLAGRFQGQQVRSKSAGGSLAGQERNECQVLQRIARRPIS